MMKKQAYLMKNGFTFNKTEQVIEALESKTTKASQNTLRKMKETYKYTVVSNGVTFTVLSQYGVTKEEQKQIASVLKEEYKEDSQLMRDAGQWETYLVACHADTEEMMQILRGTKKEEKPEAPKPVTSNEYLQMRNANFKAQRNAEMRRG